MSFAPIVLFVYNRPEHTRKTVEALQKNLLAEDSQLFIFSDAPKNEAAAAGVAEVRAYLKIISGFKSISITERQENWGLAKSIVQGVGDILKEHGRIIVLEDDIVTSPYFLQFMNQALEMYQDEPRAMHVSGYFLPVQALLPETFFYRQTSCWGWGTWERAWRHFKPDAGYLLAEIQNKGKLTEFNMNGSFNFSSQLKANIEGRINTWAIKWQASVFLQNGLCLHPSISLTENIGNDGSGVHATNTTAFDTILGSKPIRLEKQPVEEREDVNQAIEGFFRKVRPSFLLRVKNKLKRTLSNHA